MTIEFIGIASTHPGSETETGLPGGPVVQPGYLRDLALAHEESGFDRVLGASEDAATEAEAWQRAARILAKETGAPGNTTALVGSYEQVAEALTEYVRIGVGTLLIRGFDPLDDARDYGNLVRLVRERVLVEA